ncbi:M48 family metalloprotease [Candidatus Nitrotoga sp. 1052]|uniref:M48 family metalloprotease n=1 Tax=Candidatus Nitrotoga sp. 1052 TaxID=2886964 RepID=UPI001EF44D47|nr:M48 family metalloprotease [Candidatus Nitrotoga sp. 1052]CAH1081818.1 Peptidase family M48 [Candidatus Nitrotoga sp. 1052]
MKAIMKYLSVTVLMLACSTGWSFDFEEEFKKVIKDGVQKKIEEKSDAATSSALLGLVGISQEEEITIGRQIAGNLLGASALIKDQSLQIYVNNVGRWVASQSERPDLTWHFGVIESSDVNAFAAPGGYIFLTRGLYSLLQNEAELAGVLGHEIGHVIRKHHLKILQQSSLVDLGGKLISRRIGGNDKVQKLIGNGAEIVARSLDKNAEFEADRIAVVLAARAGYDAFALPEVLQQIGHFAKDDGSVALLFKTHPHPDDRLEKLGLVMNDRLEDVKGKTLVARFYRIKP